MVQQSSAMRYIDAYLDDLRMRDCSERTIGARRYWLSRLDTELPHGLDQASADELRAILYRDEWAAQTKAAAYNAICGFFRFCTDPLDRRLDFDPTIYLHRPKVARGVPDPVTDGQLADILRRAAEPYHLWVLLAAYGGLRCIEISRLDREHVSQSLIRVVGKGNKPATIPTHPYIWEAIEPLPFGPVAVNPKGRRYDAQRISILGAAYFQRTLQMPDVHMHRFRHWFGTMTLRATKDLRVTQELLRHESPATTAIYTLVADVDRAAAVSALPRLA